LLYENVSDNLADEIELSSDSDDRNSARHKIATKEDILGVPIK